MLGAQDEVGLIDYYWGSAERLQLGLRAHARRADYEKLVPLINQAEPGDMPDFHSPHAARPSTGLKKSDAALKHLIVISDGDPSPPTPALVQQFIDAKVSVSMIAINPHGGRTSRSCRPSRSRPAAGIIFPQDPAQAPAIFIKEAKTLKRSMLQNKIFTPQVEFPSPVLKGIDAVPPLARLRAHHREAARRTILRVPPDKEATDRLDPLLATWRFGLGTTAAWTSDLAPLWAQDWLGWEKYRAFVKQLARKFRASKTRPICGSARSPPGTMASSPSRISRRRKPFSRSPARVTGPARRDGNRAAAPDRAAALPGAFPLSGKGRYQVLAAGEGGGRSERAVGSFAVPYSPEYLSFRSDPRVLQQIAARTAGRVLTGNETGRQLFLPERETRESSRSVIDWFLLLAACLVPLDVAVRRVQWDAGALRDWLRRRREPGARGTGEKDHRDAVRLGEDWRRDAGGIDWAHEQMGGAPGRRQNPRCGGGPDVVTSAPGTVETVTESAMHNAAMVSHGYDT